MPTAFLHHKFQIKLYTEVLFPHLHLNYYYFQHPQFKMSGNIQKTFSHILNFKIKTLNMKRPQLPLGSLCVLLRSFVLETR